MADFIFKPSSNGEGVFTSTLEFEGFDPTESVAVADGTYDIYQKVVSGFQVGLIATQFDVAAVGEEPVVTATGGTISITVASGIHAGTYTQRASDGATLTVAMIEAGPTCFKLPGVAGTTGDGDTLTVVPGLWLYAGTDPGDQTWQQQLNGADISGGTDLSYTIQTADDGATFTVEETFGGVTVESAPLVINFAASAFTPADLANAIAYDLSDPNSLSATDQTGLGITDGGGVTYIANTGSAAGYEMVTYPGKPAPAYSATEGGVIFTSTDQALYSAPRIIGSDTRTVVIAIRPTANQGVVYGGAGNATRRVYYGIASSGSDALAQTALGSGEAGRSTTNIAGVPTVVTIQHDDSTFELRINGVLEDSGSISGSISTTSQNAIGGYLRDVNYIDNVDFGGVLYGIADVVGTISSSDRENLEAWAARLLP